MCNIDKPCFKQKSNYNYCPNCGINLNNFYPMHVYTVTKVVGNDNHGAIESLDSFVKK